LNNQFLFFIFVYLTRSYSWFS